MIVALFKGRGTEKMWHVVSGKLWKVLPLACRLPLYFHGAAITPLVIFLAIMMPVFFSVFTFT